MGPLRDKQLLTLLCPSFLANTKINNHHVCWECNLMINKIKEFQKKIRTTQYYINKCNVDLTLTKTTKDCPLTDGLSSLQYSGVETIHILPEIQPLSTISDVPMTNLDKPVTYNGSNGHFSGITKLKSQMNEPVPNSMTSDFEELIQPAAILSRSLNDKFEPSVSICDPSQTLTTKNITPILESTIDMIDEDTIMNSEIFFRSQKPYTCIPDNNAPKGIKETVRVTVGLTNTFPNENITIPDIGIDVLIPDLQFMDYQIVPFLLDNVTKTYVRNTGINYNLKLLTRSEVFEFRKALKMRYAYHWSRYKCTLCIMHFPNQAELENHSLKHERTNGAYECEVCTQRFINTGSRDEHCKNHYIIFKCTKCAYSTNDTKKMSEHIGHLHDNTEFICKPCNEVFKTIREKYCHIKTVHVLNTGDATPKEPHSLKHADLKHHQSKTIREKYCHIKTVYVLNTGDATPKEPHSLKHADLKHHQSKSKRLFRSVEVQTVNIIVPKKPAPLVRCTVCKKKYKRRFIEYHMESHETPQKKSKKSGSQKLPRYPTQKKKEKLTVKCHHCEEFFTNKAVLKTHIYSLNKNFSCATCLKSFTSRRDFRKHISWAHENDPVPEMNIEIERVKTEIEDIKTEVEEYILP